ncbi:phosphatases II [Trametopsis cervina]|nr:phosphatases II [Trametopsis cervina]
MSVVCESGPSTTYSPICRLDSPLSPLSSSSSSSSSSNAAVTPVPTLRDRPRPIPNSYWATPYLVACEFPYCPLTPADLARKKTKQKLDALLLAGVRTFIDLTEPHELFPYAPHLAERCTLLGISPSDVTYHNFPIRDRSLPQSVDFMRSILDVLQANEKQGRVCAVHCRGGIGRTGMVVGCWLVESGRARDGAHALQLIAEEWKQVEKCKRFPCSPETGPQFEFVRAFTPSAPSELLSA